MTRIIMVAVAMLTFGFNPFYGLADVDIPWSTTYDCADWTQYADALDCDGLSKHGAWTASPEVYYEQITSAANYPEGRGGKGQRHWIGDGTNNNSGGTRVQFNSPQSKFWMRWYMRWEAGFGAFGHFKVLYGFNGSVNGPCFDFGPENSNVSVQYLISGTEYADGGWGVQFYPSMASDGSWVLNEIFVDVTGQKVKWWINEDLVLDRDVQFKGPVGFIIIGSNQKTVSNGRSMYIDYDDIAISNTGYIGPVSGGSGSGSGDAGGSENDSSGGGCFLRTSQ